MHRIEAAFLCLLALAAFGSAGAGVMDLPVPADYVADHAGVMDPASRGRVSALLKELEEKTGAQVIVLTVKSLEGRPIEEVSLHLAHDRWKLGQKGRDNGVLILVAPAERKYRIEVGYGLESILPDSLAGTIGRRCFVPHFRRGDFGAGIASAVTEIALRIASDAGVALTVLPEGFSRSRDLPGGARAFQKIMRLLVSLIILIVAPIVLILHRFGPRRRVGWGPVVFWVGGSGGGWSGGGGFGGGFSGGGGGGFGGGGASGGW